MQTVHKYVLNWADEQEISMPRGAEILHFNNQNDLPTIWARVDTRNPPTGYNFSIRGTGQDNADGPYIRTAFFHEDDLVFHLFWTA
jgi:hypothetical protein